MPKRCSISPLTTTPWHSRLPITARRSRSSSRQPEAPEGGRAARLDGLAVRRQLPAVLDVVLADRADRAHSEPDQVGAGLRRVALEVAVERAVAARARELVVGPREVVHADVLEARVREPRERGAEDLELRRPRRAGAARGRSGASSSTGRWRTSRRPAGRARSRAPGRSCAEKLSGVWWGRP